MLWFSIPMVVLLAAIPLLIIVSQTEDFNVRKYFTWSNINMTWCFLWAASGAYSGQVLFTVIMTSTCIFWCYIDSLVKGEW